MSNEPSRLIALISAAITVTIGLLALLFHWPEEVSAGLVIVAGAWLAVAGEIVRSLVVPKGNVRMTEEQFKELLAAGYQVGKRKLNQDGDLDAR